MRKLASLVSVALAVSLCGAVLGCAPTTLRSRRSGGDAGVPPGDVDPIDEPDPECGPGLPECPTDFLCQSPAGVPRCVRDPSVPIPVDAICGGEFDDGCGTDMLCIAGHCTPDPRIPVGCTDASMCPAGFACEAGTCACHFSADCPSGLECVAGACVPGLSGCVADAECPAGAICEDGRCIDRSLCETTNPDLTGTWQVHSVLRFREALPSSLSGLLDALEGPFRFLGGETTCSGLGLSGLVESLVCDVIGPYVDAHFPAWLRSLLVAIADLNTVLATWDIDETMILTPGALPDTYRGTHTWDRIRFTSRSTSLVADPTTVFDWSFEPSTFDAAAVCGTFEIRRHDVEVSIGRIIAWLVDGIVEEASGGEYTTLGSLLSGLSGDFCDGLADAASSATSTPGVSSLVRSACTSELRDLTSAATAAIDGARLGLDAITLRGSAPIAGPDSLPGGLWDGTLLGSDFSGDFDGTR